MKQKSIHYNPQETQGLTACGRVASSVIWRLNANGVTCKPCLREMAKRGWK